MMIPFPNGRAEECAKDLASDCRKLVAEAIKLRDALATGEASLHDHSNLELLNRQIQSLSDVVCVDIPTGEEFHVSNYLTPKRATAEKVRRAFIQRAYHNLTKWLH